MTHEDRMNNLCANLLRLRKEWGITQQEMARILGVGVRTLSTVERGTVPRRLGASVLTNAADCFGCTVEELFTCVSS